MTIAKRISLTEGFVSVLLAACVIVAPLWSQSSRYLSRHYTVKDGLSQNYVYCMLQDSKGFMWFGTRDGLNKFDGYSFTHFKHKPFDAKSISHNIIRDLVEDKHGMIWIATGGGGLCMYNRFTNEFTTFRNDPKNPNSLSNDYVESLFLDDQRKLWIGTLGGGLNVLALEQTTGTNDSRAKKSLSTPLTFKHYRYDEQNFNGISGDYVGQIKQDRSGNFLIKTKDLLDIFDPATETWKHFGCSVQDSSLIPVRNFKEKLNPWIDFNTIVGSHAERLWINMANSTYSYDDKTQSFHRINSPNGSLIQVDKQGFFWCIHNGLHTISADPNRWREDVALPSATLYDNFGSYYSAIEDSHGGVWIGTEEGVFRYKRSSSGFIHQAESFDVRSICETPEGQVWLGTRMNNFRTLDVLSGKTKELNVGEWVIFKSLGYNITNVISSDSSDVYWIGTWGGIFTFAKGRTAKKVMLDAPLSRVIDYSGIFTIMHDSHGPIWFGGSDMSHGVLFKYNPSNNTSDTTDNVNRSVLANCGTGVWKLFEDSKRRLWIATTEGVFLTRAPTENVRFFRYDPEDYTSLSHNECWAVFEDSQRRLWFGTMGGGLNLWDEKTNTFKHFIEEDGLAGNVVYAILEDHRGTLWISTNNGISNFNPGTNVFRNYVNQEIQNVGQFHPNACLRARSSHLMFGGKNGVLRFHPDSIRENRQHSPIMITSFAVLGRRMRDEISTGEEISIPYSDNYVTMEFASIDFRNPQKLQYAYMLEGLHHEWIHVGTRRYLSFSNLSPGDYLLRIKAKNADGVWNEAGFSMTLRVIPPLYLKPWFQWTFGIVLIVSVIALSYWRAEHLRRKEQNKRRLVESELQALRLQMNPHFIFNSLNSIQHFVMHNDMENANSYLTKFARLMRMILENSKQPTILLSDEIEFLHLYLEIESFRFEGQFQYSINVDPAFARDVQIPSMLLQPYIENAIRHGLHHKTGMGSLMIDLRAKDDMVIAVIEDNGIGRMKAMEIKRRQGALYKSFGMDITHDRLEILNTVRKKEMSLNIVDLHDEKGEPSGTRVEIYIPPE